MASASVLAPTAAEADALATAFFILGVEKAETMLAQRMELEAVLLAAGDVELAPTVREGLQRTGPLPYGRG